MLISNIHVSLCSINLYFENGPGKKCIWKRICQIHQIRWIKYKYKYKYMVWNLIKYKYKYKYAVFVFVFVFANTNTYLTPALPPTHNKPHFNRLCANFTWTLNTIFSTGVYHTGGFNAMYTGRKPYYHLTILGYNWWTKTIIIRMSSDDVDDGDHEYDYNKGLNNKLLVSHLQMFPVLSGPRPSPRDRTAFAVHSHPVLSVGDL